MKISQRLLLLFIVIAIVFGAFFYLFNYIKQEEMKVYIEYDNNQQRLALNALIATKSDQQMRFLDEFSINDDIYSAVASHNVTKAEKLLTPLISSFGYSVAQIYDEQGHLLLNLYSESLPELNNLLIDSIVLDSLKTGKAMQYFHRLQHLVLENAISSIHSSADTMREDKIAGYLLIAQVWDQKRLSEFTKLLDFNANISLSKPIASDEDKATQYRTTITFPLNDLNGYEIAWLTFTRSNPYLRQLRSLGNLILFGTLGFIFIFLLVHFILIHQWISSPLQLISNSLSDNDPEYIKPLLDKSNEFAAIALLIQNFFVQKDQLIQEIEERIRTEAKLKEAEEQTRKILLTSPEAIIVTDIRGKVLSINAEGLKILGVENEESVLFNPISAKDFVARWELRALYQMLAKLRKGIPVKNLEITFDNGKGQSIPSLVSASVITDNEGKPNRFIFIARDITDLKNLERQLRQSQKMESIGTLAGGIAHDFNNIITIIAGYIALARGKISDPQASEADLNQAIKACLRAKSLIGKILTFARQGELEVEQVSVKEVLEDALPMIRATLPSNINIETNIECERFVMADVTELQQVLINLASNAFHAMRPDGGTLTIKLNEISGFELIGIDPHIELERDYLHLEVSDTGFGIAPEIINRIFDPYFSTKAAGEGTGLGLSIVHGIITSYKGFITVHSIPGEGTSFHIFLPIVNAPKEAKKEEQPKTVYPYIPAKLMVIDDEPDLADIFHQALTNAGYDVQSFNNSTVALEAFENNPDDFDLVIADVTMPQLDGMKLTAKIKALRNIPVILYTGFSDHGVQQRATEAKVDRLLSKPLLPDELVAEVRRILYLISGGDINNNNPDYS